MPNPIPAPSIIILPFPFISVTSGSFSVVFIASCGHLASTGNRHRSPWKFARRDLPDTHRQPEVNRRQL